MAANDAFGVEVDLTSVIAGLDRLAGPIAYSLARSMGVAAGQVLRDEAKLLAPTGADKWYGSSKTPGLLKSAIYLAFSDRRSTTDHVTYSVTWNSRKAPHGHLVEFGHIQRFIVERDKAGDWYTTKIPLEAPRYVAGHPFLRPALDSASARAGHAAIERAKVRYPELLQEAYQPADEAFV